MSQQQPKPPPPPSTPQKSSVSTSVVKKELSNSDLGIPDLPSLEFTSIFKSVKKGVKTGVKTAVKAGKSCCSCSKLHFYLSHRGLELDGCKGFEKLIRHFLEKKTI